MFNGESIKEPKVFHYIECSLNEGINSRGNNHSIPLKLENKNKFIDIAAQYNISIALSFNNVFHVWGKVSDHLISMRPKERN
jgi:hypothetical protein